MIEPGIRKAPQTCIRQSDAGGDQIGVKPGGMRGSDNLSEIAPRRRFAAGKMHMQNAERRGFGKDPRPGLRYRVHRRAAPAASGFEQ